MRKPTAINDEGVRDVCGVPGNRACLGDDSAADTRTARSDQSAGAAIAPHLELSTPATTEVRTTERSPP